MLVLVLVLRLVVLLVLVFRVTVRVRDGLRVIPIDPSVRLGILTVTLVPSRLAIESVSQAVSE